MSTGFFCKCKHNNLLHPVNCCFDGCQREICFHIYKQDIYYCNEHISKLFDSRPENNILQDSYKFSNSIGFIEVEVKSVGEYNCDRDIEDFSFQYFPKDLEDLWVDFECEIEKNIWSYGKYALTNEDKIIMEDEYGYDTDDIVNYRLKFHYIDEYDYSDEEHYDTFLVTIQRFKY